MVNINYYLSGNNEDIQRNNKYQKLVSSLVSTKKIDLLEYAYLVNFYKEKGTLVNINWYIDIINRCASKEFNDLSVEMYPNYFKLKNNVLTLSINDMFDAHVTNKKNAFEFTQDQKNAIKDLFDFMANPNERAFGLYGYAGTGKTTTIVETMNYLLENKYIKSVAFAAPTNKAVNIMKAKFRNHLKNLACTLLGIRHDMLIHMNIDDILVDLLKQKIKIEFMSIHRLLNYKNDFNAQGERVFVKGEKSNIKEFQIIIIDECSMIPLNIIANLFEEIRENVKLGGNNLLKMPKVIFTGDPSQLPPVSEKQSAVFITERSITEEEYRRAFPEIQAVDAFKEIVAENIKNSVIELQKDIIAMRNTTMKDVVRNKIGNVVNLCYNIRQWVLREINKPQPSKYTGEGVSIYKYNGKDKIESLWFKKYIENITSNNANGNIILTWTNKQSKAYNNFVRKTIFNKKKLDKYEIGDILVLSDFYVLDETKVKSGKDSKNRFYTSEQIRVCGIKTMERKCADFSDKLPTEVQQLKSATAIEKRLKNIASGLNSKTKRSYKIWRLSVSRIADGADEKEDHGLYDIDVTTDENAKQLEVDKEYAAGIIKSFRGAIMAQYKDSASILDKHLIKQLWREWSKIFTDPFATVNYGYSITTHNSQASTYFNVFVDVDDIFLNRMDDETRRCLYTALTRASNNIYLLV